MADNPPAPFGFADEPDEPRRASTPKRADDRPGHVFEPPAPIKDFDWFAEIMRATAISALAFKRSRTRESSPD